MTKSFPNVEWAGKDTTLESELGGAVLGKEEEREQTSEHSERCAEEAALCAETDEHEGDDMLPAPYTSTSTEAIALASVKSVVVTRMVTNPTDGPTPPAEAVLTIGWGGVSRVDLEPATCGDPECDADHGYSGTLTADDFSIRVSAAADGPDAVPSLLSFAESLSARTHD